MDIRHAYIYPGLVVCSSSCQAGGLVTQVTWHSSLDEVPQDGPTIIIAHEFFDALPVHQFQRTPHGWREILVDDAAAADAAGMQPLRFVLAPGSTPASHLLLPLRLQALNSAYRAPIPVQGRFVTLLPFLCFPPGGQSLRVAQHSHICMLA